LVAPELDPELVGEPLLLQAARRMAVPAAAARVRNRAGRDLMSRSSFPCGLGPTNGRLAASRG
jgi:hypothetical protein